MEKEVPKGWVETEIDNLFYLVYGKGLLTKDLTDEGYNVYGANGIIGKYSKYLYKDSKVIISCRGAGCGIIHRTKPFAYITSNSIVFDDIISNHINLDFIKYALESIDKDDVITGTAQPQITIQLLKNLQIPFPPLPEQQRIVAKLDILFGHLDALKTRLDRIPQLLKDFRQKVLTQAVTGKLTEKFTKWDKTKLGDLVLKGGIFDGPFGSHLKTEDYTSNGVRVIRLENIEHLIFIEDKETFVSEEKYNTLIRHTVNEGDIIFSSFISEDIRACILPELKTKAIAKADCFCIRPDETAINKKYLLFFLVSYVAFNQLVLKIHGATRPRINTTQLKTLLISLPELREQQEIVRHVESLSAKADKIEASYQKLKAKIEQLPQALLAKAFRGELVAQLSTDGDARDLLEQIKWAKEGLEKGGKSKKLKAEDEVRMVAEDGARYGK